VLIPFSAQKYRRILTTGAPITPTSFEGGEKVGEIVFQDADPLLLLLL